MLEVDTPEIARERLINWLKQESERHFGGHAVHTLHLWDWEVQLLLAALRPEVTEQKSQKPLMTSYRFGSVGDAQHMGQDAPLPGDGWVREKDR